MPSPLPAGDNRISSFQRDSVTPKHPHGRRRYSTTLTLKTRTVEELAADPALDQDAQWLVHQLVPVGGLTLVYGIGKGGKTTFLAHLCSAIISGTPFIDRPVKPGPVLWLDLEQHLRLTRSTLTKAEAINQMHSLHVYNGPAPEIDAVVAKVEQLGAVAVVVDSLSKLLQLRDENDAAEVTRCIDPLLQLAHHTDAAVLAIHHDRKREGPAGRSIRGSSAILAAIDVGIHFKPEGSKEEGKRSLECVSRYTEANIAFAIRLTDGGYVVHGAQLPDKHADVLEALASSPMTAGELAAKLNRSRPGVVKWLKDLEESQRVRRTGRGTKAEPFVFSVLVDAATPVLPTDATPFTTGVSPDGVSLPDALSANPVGVPMMQMANAEPSTAPALE